MQPQVGLVRTCLADGVLVPVVACVWSQSFLIWGLGWGVQGAARHRPRAGGVHVPVVACVWSRV